jgi:hypothetical protein
MSNINSVRAVASYYGTKTFGFIARGDVKFLGTDNTNKIWFADYEDLSNGQYWPISAISLDVGV